MKKKAVKTKGINNISLPSKDVKIEVGQPTFLQALTKVVKKGNKA